MRPPDHLVKRITRGGSIDNVSVPRPLVTLEEFFEGNEEAGSIGCNLPDAPAPRELYEVFRKIRDRPDVADVRVEVSEWDGPEDWPFSEAVWVITSVSPYDLQLWLKERLRGDEVRVGWPEYPVERVEVPPGMQPLCIWYD
jgi:hypothetical protein